MIMSHPSPLVQKFWQEGTLQDCPIIDVHGHWGPMPGGYLPAAPEKKMMASLERSGVKHIICSSHDSLFGDPEDGNALMQAAIRRYPGRISGYWAVNPNYPDLVHRAALDFEKSEGFVGFKILPDYHGCSATAAPYQPLFEYANARHLPVMIHTWGGSTFNSPQRIDELAGRYPEAVLIMGHSGFGDWAVSAEIARRRPNVYLDLTACYAAHDFGMLPGGSGTPLPLMSQPHVSGVTEFLVEQAGSEKVFFGTDMPWYSPFYVLGSILFARINDDARRDILYRNAQRLFNLKIV